MASTTPNFSLRKPAGTDLVNVTTDISDNMDLIDAHDHNGTYAPLSGAVVEISASSLTATTGGPAISDIARLPFWHFDASIIEGVGGSLVFPPGWATFHVDVFWTNAGAGAGNVVWRWKQQAQGDGLVVGLPTGADTTVAAPVQNTMKVTRVSADSAVPGAGQILGLNLWRQASVAADTLGNDAAVQCLVFTRAS